MDDLIIVRGIYSLLINENIKSHIPASEVIERIQNVAGNKDKHMHHKCDHKIEYCLPCDEAYCIECATVFTNTPCRENHYPSYSTGIFTYPDSTTTTIYGEVVGDGDDGRITISNDVHADHVTLT